MSKITKRQLHNGWHCHDTEIIKMKKELRELKQSVLRLEKLTDEKLLDEPQLKQLDQSVFDGEPEQIKWAVVTNEGAVLRFELEPVVKDGLWHWTHSNGCRQHSLIGQYDASNWQNSLIEREKKELTGSELCKAMLARGDKWVVCRLADTSDEDALNNGRPILVTKFDGDFYHKEADQYWKYAVPINNKGEPLTAAEVGL